jgi:protein ImuA
MRCKGVSATIAQVGRLSRIEARRLQLAAEQGGGIGILLRPMDRNASVYAAASRWLVSPAQGLRTVQRWKIQLIHAHGGRIGQTVILEHHRETNTLRASEQLANRQSETVATEVA